MNQAKKAAVAEGRMTWMQARRAEDEVIEGSMEQAAADSHYRIVSVACRWHKREYAELWHYGAAFCTVDYDSSGLPTIYFLNNSGLEGGYTHLAAKARARRWDLTRFVAECNKFYSETYPHMVRKDDRGEEAS